MLIYNLLEISYKRICFHWAQILVSLFSHYHLYYFAINCSLGNSLWFSDRAELLSHVRHPPLRLDADNSLEQPADLTGPGGAVCRCVTLESRQ